MKTIFSRITVFFIVVATTITAAIPVFAATPEKYADCTTNAQKIDWLKSTYGITDMDPWTEQYYGPNYASIEVKALNNIELGWRLIGTSTTKKIFNWYLNQMVRGPKFYMTVGLMAFNGGFNGGKSQISMGIKADYNTGFVAPASTVVHETIHAWDFGMLGDAGAKKIESINGSYSGYTNANQYATQYAADQAKEDFAETCMTMIVNGGDTPTTVGKDTILYKKYKACYDLMVEHFGEKSTVKRSAAFLGLTVQ